jgi:hypothetical protein
MATLMSCMQMFMKVLLESFLGLGGTGFFFVPAMALGRGSSSSITSSTMASDASSISARQTQHSTC